MKTTIKVPTQLMLTIATLEMEKQRKSPEYIAECSAVKDIPNAWIEVTEELQKTIMDEICDDFDFSEEENFLALNIFRRAYTLYPTNRILQNAIHVKHNLANKGKFVEGDIVPNIPIHTIDGKVIDLYSTLSSTQTTLLLMGSHS